MAAASLRSVTKRLGDRLVLDRVSLDFPSDCTTAILGESGCGKTTLLHHLNGLLRPDAGRIELFGAPLDYTRLTDLRRRMGYAVQGIGLFPNLTMNDNLALMARIEGWTARRIEARQMQLMQAMELAGELVGMTRRQQLRHVLIPLSAPHIIAGIRTAAVISIGTATLAAFIGAGGLDEPIVTGLALNDTNLILQGAIPAALLTILTELAFSGLARGLILPHLRAA
ncbi:MAG: ATP-binding cassette domain-containing protein [Gammaproteobacteria bacterium]